MGAVDYAVGQCTWFVSHALNWLGISQAGNLGNAGDWLAAAKAKGMPTSMTPQVGAAVVYGPNYSPLGIGQAGHVAVVTNVNPNGTFGVAEDNWGPSHVTNYRTSTMADVEGFILPPNQAQGAVGAASALDFLQNKQFLDTSAFQSPGGQAVDAATSVVAEKIKAVMDGIASVAERGSLVIFGAVIVIIGLVILFKVPAGSSGSQGPVTTENFESTTTDQEGSEWKSANTTRTSTRRKGSGLKGIASKAALA